MHAGLGLVATSICLAAAPAYAFPWSHDLFRMPSVRPLAVPPRNMPPGTLPVAGGEPAMSRRMADGTLHNPLAPTESHLQRGEWLFQTYCMPCHGKDGAGDGPVARLMVLPPPDLTFAQPAQRSDGYLYATIRNGSIVMPAYGDAMSADERWQVVLFLRKLQGRLGGP
ncbi:MAG: cytochrome c [Nitrospirota bacterium]|jgi:mono/diheme cytochrome c family protein